MAWDEYENEGRQEEAYKGYEGSEGADVDHGATNGKGKEHEWEQEQTVTAVIYVLNTISCTSSSHVADILLHSQ